MTSLVLSGGGTRGILSLAGALSEIPQSNSTQYSGVSAGALVAYLAACGLNPAAFALQHLTKSSNEPISSFRPRIYRGYPIAYTSHKILQVLPEPSMLKRRLIIRTSNLATAREHVWDSDKHPGAPWKHIVVASMSIPFVFQPIRIFGQDHVDGGLVSNFPVDDFPNRETIGLLVKQPKSNKNPKGIKEYVRKIVDLAVNSNVSEDIEDANRNNFTRILEVETSGDSLNFQYSIKEAKHILSLGRKSVIDCLRG